MSHRHRAAALRRCRGGGAGARVRLEPPEHRTYHYWHVLVPELRAGQVYAYRAHGPFAPERGLRFDPRAEITYAQALVSSAN